MVHEPFGSGFDQCSDTSLVPCPVRVPPFKWRMSDDEWNAPFFGEGPDQYQSLRWDFCNEAELYHGLVVIWRLSDVPLQRKTTKMAKRRFDVKDTKF